jgi:translation initiation factor IF-3
LPTHEALNMARTAGMDLVEVAPNERPPVCRIMDYGKFKYHQKKNVKKHHEQQLKEVRLRPKTDDHDREIKVKKAIGFLMEGDRVQFTMQFRGRERAHKEIAHEAFSEILQELGEKVKVERAPAMDGRNMIMVLAPNKAALDKAVEKATHEKKPEASDAPAKPSTADVAPAPTTVAPVPPPAE